MIDFVSSVLPMSRETDPMPQIPGWTRFSSQPKHPPGHIQAKPSRMGFIELDLFLFMDVPTPLQFPSSGTDVMSRNGLTPKLRVMSRKANRSPSLSISYPLSGVRLRLQQFPFRTSCLLYNRVSLSSYIIFEDEISYKKEEWILQFIYSGKRNELDLLSTNNYYRNK